MPEEPVVQLWECPECKAIVSVKDVKPPLVFDAERLIERTALSFRYQNFGRVMRRFGLALLFIRFGCWISGLNCEFDEDECGEAAFCGQSCSGVREFEDLEPEDEL